MAAPPPSKLDLGQIIQRVFDEDNGRLRTDANFDGGITLDIDQDSDSIAIGDGTDLFTGSTIGSKHGLDVNVINDLVPSVPTIINFNAVLSGTEYTYAIPNNTKLLMIRPRAGNMTFSYVSNGPSRTINNSGAYTVEGLNIVGVILYFQVSNPNTIVEIETWSS